MSDAHTPRRGDKSRSANLGCVIRRQREGEEAPASNGQTRSAPSANLMKRKLQERNQTHTACQPDGRGSPEPGRGSGGRSLLPTYPVSQVPWRRQSRALGKWTWGSVSLILCPFSTEWPRLSFLLSEGWSLAPDSGEVQDVLKQCLGSRGSLCPRPPTWGQGLRLSWGLGQCDP